MSWDQLRPLTRFATTETDEFWARRASGLRPGTLWREAERYRRPKPKDEAAARRARFLWMGWDHHLANPNRPKVLHIQGMLPSEEGAALEAALLRRAEQVVLADEPDDRAGARLADALCELVTEGGGGQRPVTTLVVHADAGVLTGDHQTAGPELAETDGGQRLPSAAVRRLACDARIEWLLEADGRPVGIGRRGRTVRGPVRRALEHRDGSGCGFPGCERRMWVDAHHIRHWADGGTTDLDNLVLLCGAHHRLIHEGGWGISGRPGRDLRFQDLGGGTGRARPPAPRRDVRAPSLA